MKLLLFILGISFFFLFFLLSTSLKEPHSLFSNIYIEANIYIILSVFLIIKVLKNDFQRKKKRKEKEGIGFSYYISWGFLFPLIKDFFSRYVYYIACILFYTWIFLLLKVFLQEIHLPKMFLIFNILILSFYFIEQKFKVFQDFLRINAIIISLYYAIFQLWYLMWVWQNFLIEDIYNIFLLFVLLGLFLYSPRKKQYIPIIASYMMLYIFLEYLVIIRYFFWDINMWASIFSFWLSILFLWYTKVISLFLWLSKQLLRIWGLLFSYAFLYFSLLIILLWSPFFLLLLPAIILISITLYNFHAYYQNYISLFLGSLWFILFWYGLYKFFIPETIFYTYIAFFFFLFSSFFLFIKKIYSFEYIYDMYFFQVFSLLVNISWVIFFFFFWEISILAIAFLLLWESLFMFLLYYNFRNKALLW